MQSEIFNVEQGENMSKTASDEMTMTKTTTTMTMMEKMCIAGV